MVKIEKIGAWYRDDKVAWCLALLSEGGSHFEDYMYNHTYVEAFMELWDLSAEEFCEKLIYDGWK